MILFYFLGSNVNPGSRRVNASNFNPVTAWALGNQLVAMSHQTKDSNLRVNYGRFQENNRAGYVLKPRYMWDSSALRTPMKKIRVNILGAHHLPKPGQSTSSEIIDPFVVCSLNGVVSDSLKYKTSTVLDNGFNPVWNEVLFHFSCLKQLYQLLC